MALRTTIKSILQKLLDWMKPINDRMRMKRDNLQKRLDEELFLYRVTRK